MAKVWLKSGKRVGLKSVAKVWLKSGAKGIPRQQERREDDVRGEGVSERRGTVPIVERHERAHVAHRGGRADGRRGLQTGPVLLSQAWHQRI